MQGNHIETEVKFYITDPRALEERIRSLGGVLIQPRTHEINLRFDTPDRTLTHQRKVLRLRQDVQPVLTYKGPRVDGLDVAARQDIELVVDDFDAAEAFLIALGFEISVVYEKWRTTYNLNNLEVTLDEMPYGVFTEIEGEDAQAIQKIAAFLGLRWETRCLDSYLALFQRLVDKRLTNAKNLTFAEFEGTRFTSAELGLKPADAIEFL